MRKKATIIATLALAATLSAGAAVVAASADEGSANAFPVEFVQTPAIWTANGNGTYTAANTGGFVDSNQFLLMQTDAFVGDYSISATFQGSTTGEVPAEMNMGLIPWYLDADNFVLFYLKWGNGHGNKLVNLQSYCKLNGAHTGWNDTWLDFNPLYALKNTNEITVSVTKTLNATSTADTYTVSVSGVDSDGATVAQNDLKVIDFAVSAPYAAKQAKAGFYVHNEATTVSNIAYSAIASSTSYKSVAGTKTTARSTSATGWTYADDKYTTDASDSSSLANQAVLQNVFTEGNYQVEYTGALTGDAANKELSISPWYKDENNYLNFVLAKTASGANVTPTGKIGGTAIAEEATAFAGAIDWSAVKLTAKREGSVFTCLVNDAAAATYTNAEILDGANVAIGAGYGGFTASELSVITLEYVPYDWFNESGWYMSAATKSSVAINDGIYTLASSADETNYTRIYKATGIYNSLTVSAKFSADVQTASYGLYLYYVNETEYVSVLVKGDKAVLTAVFGEEKNTYEAALTDFDLTAEHVLAVSATFKNVKVELDGTETIAEEIEGLAELETANAGLLAIGGEVTAKEYSVSGFTPYAGVKNGEWTLSGSRLNSWTIASDGTLTSSLNGGTRFKDTLAVHDAIEYSPADGYYVAAEITINELTDVEWKAGICPYYKDADNNIYVWLAQWSAGSTAVCITGKLNGQVIGNEWRETAIAYTMKSTHLLEIQVNGDGLYVYLNKSFAPVASTSYEGLGNMEAAGFAFNCFNTAATFAKTKVSTERIFKEEGKPTFETIGTMPAAGTVGTAIKLPVISATGVGGSTAEVTVKVTDPDNAEVTLEKNSFTPAKAGTYKVSVTAKDAWNNEETQTYDIVVSAGNKKDDSSNTDKKTGCGSSIAASVALFGVIGATVTLALRKRKED